MDTEERLTYTVPEGAKQIGISRALAYQLVKEGKLPAVRMGRRLLIPKEALKDLLAKSA